MKVEITSSLPAEDLNIDDLKLLSALLRTAAKGEGCCVGTSVSLFLTNDETIERYNKKFRNIDRPTDVLSFPMFTRSELADFPLLPGGDPLALGDIIISLERCQAQAEEYGHSFQRELCFLGLHGFLHLLGYDHIEAADAKEMEAAAEKYLTSLGVER